MARSKHIRTAPLLVALFLLAALAFGTDFADAVGETIDDDPHFDPEWWVVMPIDYLLLGGLFVAGTIVRTSFASTSAADDAYAADPWASYVVGAQLMLGLDFLVYGPVDYDEAIIDILLGWAYVVSLVLLLCFVLGNPLRMRGVDESEAKRRQENFLTALPLVVAVGFVYTGQDIFANELDHVHQEYFAQISQVIPLLLVALGLEGRYFQVVLGRDPVRWTISLFVILALVIGEALAISALPVDNESWNQQLYPWHEYAAFSATLYATAMALAAVVIILLWGKRDEEDRRSGLTADDCEFL